jgi:hypothetical protein
MPKQVVMGATLKCSFGGMPSNLIVLPTNRVMVCRMPAANIMDFQAMVNIVPFGTCTSPTNPAVIAAGGSPVPCVPVITSPWIPGSPTVPIAGLPALNSTSTCICLWAGIISITNPGATTEDIP